MKFEFDPVKNERNKTKHGIDFVKGQELLNDPEAVTVPAKVMDGEKRFGTVGKIGSDLWVMVWTPKGRDTVRIISIYRAENSNFEREYYGES
jgi:uncharacterized DUF497 family protein